MRRENRAELLGERTFSGSRDVNKVVASGERLNLNDLLKRRDKEKKIDKKANLLILSGTTAVAAIVVAILSL